MKLVIRGFLEQLLVTRGLGLAVAAPLDIYPNPFASVEVVKLDPFASTTSVLAVDPFASTPVVGAPDPFASTAKYKGN